MKYNKAILLASLFDLSFEDLKEIKKKIEYLLTLHPKDTNSTGVSDSQLLYQVLAKNIENSAGVTSIPYHNFKKSKHGKKLKEVSNYLDSYIVEIFDTISKTDKIQFYNLYSAVMLKYVEKYDLPKEISILLNAYLKFAAQLDLSFPGYAVSGVLKLILRKKGEDFDKKLNTNDF